MNWGQPNHHSPRFLLFLTLAALMAGCANGSDEDETPPTPTPATTAPSVLSIPWHVEGKTPPWACGASDLGGPPCPNDSGENTRIPIETPGAPLRLIANITWQDDAADGPPARLQFIFVYSESEDDSFHRTDFEIEGTSPLAIDWDISAFAGNRTRIDVNAADETDAGPAQVTSGRPQAFVIEGVITYAPVSP